MHNTEPPAKLLRPGSAIPLPDVNNDSFGEILISGLLTKPPHVWNTEYADSEYWSTETDAQNPIKPLPSVNSLVLVCGQSGSILGAPYMLKKCKKILSLALEGHFVHFTCSGTEVKRKYYTFFFFFFFEGINVRIIFNISMGHLFTVFEHQF